MDSSGSDNSGKKRTRSQTTLDQFSFVNLANSPLKQAKSALKLNVHSLPHIPSTAASSKDSPFVTNHADTTLLEHPPRRNKADPHNPVADRQRKRPPSRGSPSVGADSTLSPNAPSLPHPQIAALSYKDPLLVTRNEDASSKETRSEREQVNGHSPVVEGRGE
ncbi:hypothetical protein FKP32DRAFT_1649099 [Trametes sanguinea]|nr:hypothetical protein FKP32DRAFT_1649099 [Trametes sanguinea]